MRFFVGLLIGIGAALAAASLWGHFSTDDGLAPPESSDGAALVERATEEEDVSVLAETLAPAEPAGEFRESATEQATPRPSLATADTKVTPPDPVTPVDVASTNIATQEDPVSEEGPSSQTASAWTPFHSRASARGFARHLTAKTGIEFDIVKEGPGHYDVVFEYANDAERRDIEGRIAAVSGTDRQLTENQNESNT